MNYKTGSIFFSVLVNCLPKANETVNLCFLDYLVVKRSVGDFLVEKKPDRERGEEERGGEGGSVSRK